VIFQLIFCFICTFVIYSDELIDGDVFTFVQRAFDIDILLIF